MSVAGICMLATYCLFLVLTLWAEATFAWVTKEKEPFSEEMLRLKHEHSRAYARRMASW